ncbi:DUF2235 domain-containing protein [Crocinitomix catalasitica]|nr:DUF2235 domain-containing protein [Crocinitomix catalasitica]
MTQDRNITQKYTKNFSADPRERKHIILLDGTWNDETGIGADGLVTNIVHLRRIFKNVYGKQIVRYHRGVGNDNDNGWFASIQKGITGKAIEGIIERAYARFVKDWEKGDHIYIFGFSRGAAGARMLASKINEMGIPLSVKIRLIPVANSETKVVEQIYDEVVYEHKYDDEKKIDNHKVDIEFLGVWDTVSALGLVENVSRYINPDNWEDLFTDCYIADNIKKAVHLLAIDETRNPFVPSLMNHDKREKVVHEVWFPGVHSDIGGSYKEGDIAKVSLYYMLSQLGALTEESGFEVDSDEIKKYCQKRVKRANFHFHGLGKGQSLRKLYVQKEGKMPDNLAKGEKVKIHQLYYDIAADRNAWSIFNIKRWFRKDLDREVNFQYKPFNVKELKRNYDIVE